MQSRYYVSETGRFLNSDVVLGIEGSPLSNNLFSYTQNNPINYIDSNGLVRTKVYIGSAAWMQIALMCFGSGTGFWIMKLSVWGVGLMGTGALSVVGITLLAISFALAFVSVFWNIPQIVLAIYYTIRDNGFKLKTYYGIGTWYVVEDLH